jgi:hypothetical protein
MTLGAMRKMGITHLDLVCDCGHEGDANVDHLEAELEIPSLAGIFKCSQCGAHPKVRPDWSQHNASGNMS